jgi:ribosomal protein S18 acetylase RimI-like enzyme
MTNASLQLRRATSADVPCIVALVERAYRGEVSRAGWTTEADLLDGQRTDRDEIAALCTSDTGRLVLALEGGALCGSVHLAPEPGGLYLGMLAVQPSLQGRGVGRALLDEAERILRSEQLGRRIRMTVIGQRSELITWYVRYGYRVTGQREPFPYGQPRFGLPRRSDLYFEVLEKLI